MAAELSPGIGRIDAAALHELLGQPDLAVVDIRLPFDYFGGRIPAALNLPDRMIVERVDVIRADARLVFVCDDGTGSVAAAEAARGAGFTNVSVLDGGMDAWLDADLPIETISDGMN